MNNKDLSRTHLVTKFVCSKCRSNLRLTYDGPSSSHKVEGEPTGAVMVENIITIHPCEECLAPIRRMKNATKELLQLLEDKENE